MRLLRKLLNKRRPALTTRQDYTVYPLNIEDLKKLMVGNSPTSKSVKATCLCGKHLPPAKLSNKDQEEILAILKCR